MPKWQPWSAPLALLTGFGGALVAGVVIGIVGAIAGASVSNPPPEVVIVATLFQDGALVASAIYFAARAAPVQIEQFGLRATRVGQAAKWIVVTWIAFVTFSAAWAAALNIHDKEKIVDQLGANESAAALVAVCALTCVVAPVAEEFFFRGFFFVALRNWRGVWPAALITGLVFGGIHVGSAPAAYLVPLAVFGFFLCLLYERTRSLYPCIVLHALNNSVAFGITEHWGWQIPVLAAASLGTIALTLRSVARLAPAH
jgi:hypothetical protein